MPALLLAIPGTFATVCFLLALTETMERRVLSPRALVVRVARDRRATPEHAELLVSQQLARFFNAGH
ncbi:MAG TPA: hypothetical protein VM030_10900 [Acidimicrobiales bacterium]|nr:hypothetical protein [Acidimicrobiales bacterium]